MLTGRCFENPQPFLGRMTKNLEGRDPLALGEALRPPVPITPNHKKLYSCIRETSSVLTVQRKIVANWTGQNAETKPRGPTGKTAISLEVNMDVGRKANLSDTILRCENNRVLFPSGFTPPDPQASSIVVGWRPWIFNFNFTATRVFTSFAALACCKSTPPARYRIAARAPPCGSTRKASEGSPGNQG